MVAIRAQTDEAAQWERCKAGDVAARDRLAERYFPNVVKLAKVLAGRLRVDADDLTGIGALALLHAIDRFDPGRGYKFWTFAEHSVRGVMVRDARKRPVVCTDVFPDETPDVASTGVPLQSHLETVEAFDRAVRIFDEDHRAVLLLAFVEDMRDDEIARVLNWKPAEVAAAKRRALAALDPNPSPTPTPTPIRPHSGPGSAADDHGTPGLWA